MSAAWDAVLDRSPLGRSSSGILASCTSALLCALSAPPFDLWPLAFVCWLPLVVAIERVSWRRAAALGLVQGAFTNALTQSWLVAGLHGAGAASVPAAGAAFVVLSLWQGARSAIVAVLYVLAVRRGWPRTAAFPLALVAGELVHPMIFPWFTAVLVSARPELLQLAELGGPLLVSGWLGFVNACLAIALIERGGRPAVRAVAAAVTAFAAVALFGVVRIHAVDARLEGAPSLRIGMVQGDVDKRGREARDSVMTLRAASLDLIRREQSFDLLVWPETAVPYPTAVSELSRFLRDHALRDRRLGDRAERIRVPLLAGMVLSDSTGTPGVSRLSNSAVLSDEHARILGVYDKQHLVPLAEQAPLSRWIEGMRRLAPPLTEFAVVREPRALRLGDRRLLVSICYEDILHAPFRDAVRRTQPDLFVNLTSDSWFAGSAASSLHLALARLRAIEHRRYLVRATNDGVTAAVDPTGRIAWQLEPGRLAAGVATVRLLREPTPYERLGDVPGRFATAMALALAAMPRRRLRSGQESDSHVFGARSARPE